MGWLGIALFGTVILGVGVCAIGNTFLYDRNNNDDLSSNVSQKRKYPFTPAPNLALYLQTQRRGSLRLWGELNVFSYL